MFVNFITNWTYLTISKVNAKWSPNLGTRTNNHENYLTHLDFKQNIISFKKIPASASVGHLRLEFRDCEIL